jgi:predicted PurR-regulated permease PerM
VTGDVIEAVRRYFLGVTIVAAFNAVVVGGVAWLLGVALAGTIAVVTFVTAYIPTSARSSRGRSRFSSRSPRRARRRR